MIRTVADGTTVSGGRVRSRVFVEGTLTTGVNRALTLGEGTSCDLGGIQGSVLDRSAVDVNLLVSEGDWDPIDCLC